MYAPYDPKTADMAECRGGDGVPHPALNVAEGPNADVSQNVCDITRRGSLKSKGIQHAEVMYCLCAACR